MDVTTICSDENRVCTEEEIKFVIEKTNSADLTQLKYALKSLGNFARLEANRNVLELGGAAKFARDSLQSPIGDAEVISLAARLIGNMTYDHSSNRDKFVALGVVPKLVESIRDSNNDDVIKNVCGALANLASENEQIQNEMLDQGGLQILARWIVSDNSAIQSLAIRALHNVADNKRAQAKAAEGDILPNLVHILRDYKSADSYVRDSIIEIFISLTANEGVSKRLMERLHIASLVCEIIQQEFVETSWKQEEEEEEEGEGEEEEKVKPFAVTCSVFLVHLANIDSIRSLFWSENLAIPILEKTIIKVDAPDLETKKAKAEVICNLGRCFALLSMFDSATETVMANLNTVIQEATSEDPGVKLNGIMVLVSLAKSDELCDKLMQHGVHKLVVDSMNAFGSDQRIVHVGLTALHNLSIPKKNKAPIVEAGALELAIQHLSTPNQLIQYEAIGILKSKFVELDGVPPLLALSNTKFEVAEKPKEGEDPRVMYESARLLCRLIINDEMLNRAGEKVVSPFVQLITSQFSILQIEGAQALLIVSQKGENSILQQIKEALPQIVEVISKVPTSTQQGKVLAGLLSKLVNAVSSKVGVESDLLEKFRQFEIKE